MYECLIQVCRQSHSLKLYYRIREKRKQLTGSNFGCCKPLRKHSIFTYAGKLSGSCLINVVIVLNSPKTLISSLAIFSHRQFSEASFDINRSSCSLVSSFLNCSKYLATISCNAESSV